MLTQKTYSDILGLIYSKEIFISTRGEKLVDAYVTDNVTLICQAFMAKGLPMLVAEKITSSYAIILERSTTAF